MTASEKVCWLESLPGETISPTELAKVAGGNAYSYNLAAKEGKLDLPHLWRGRNLRIWKGPVIRLIGGSDVQAVSDGRGEADEGSDDGRRSERTHHFLSYDEWRRVIGCPIAVGSDLKEAEQNGHS